MKILVLNSGSSSQKTALFDLEGAVLEEPARALWEATIAWHGSRGELEIRNSRGAATKGQVEAADRKSAIAQLLQNLTQGPTYVLRTSSEIEVAGHRIVHGGPKLKEATWVTPEVKKTIEEVSAIAPLHNRAELEGIEMVEKLLPNVPQVAAFDTGFHRTLPLAAAVYPGPYRWYESGIRRYGFHGINHQYCAERAAQLVGRDVSALRIVSCHLGNGCSLAAIASGNSLDTTMGFTPLEGLMMGTRSGSIDPGILTYLLRTHQAQAGELDGILNQKSGLLGISGVSSDMREVLAAARQGNTQSKLAFDMFVHRLQKEIGAMTATLGGLDVLVFTAGIGENSGEVRAAACGRLKFLGVEIDSEKNSKSLQAEDGDISATGSAVRVLVIRAQEDLAIARECVRLHQAGKVPGAS
jgi:acetate kinase